MPEPSSNLRYSRIWSNLHEFSIIQLHLHKQQTSPIRTLRGTISITIKEHYTSEPAYSTFAISD